MMNLLRGDKCVHEHAYNKRVVEGKKVAFVKSIKMESQKDLFYYYWEPSVDTMVTFLFTHDSVNKGSLRQMLGKLLLWKFVY